MFRIWLYLDIANFFSNLFFKKPKKKIEKLIQKILSDQANKRYTVLCSQCRVGFFYILKFIKKKYHKNEIIFCAYNLPEMINIAANLNLKIKFCDVDYKTGLIDLKKLKKKISKKTAAIVLTNMFNSYPDSIKIKKIAKKNNINLIEDNAIYFDNFYKTKKNIFYSGTLGDYTIYSFNIMKNISSLYGGAISTNDKHFINFFEKETSQLKNFSNSVLMKQILIFFILKLMSIKLLYKSLFRYIIEYSHKNKINFILKLFYPSLKNIKRKFPSYYSAKISNLSLYLTYDQLNNFNRRKILFKLRKEKNHYYFKKFSALRGDNLNLIKISDKNYQNFLDFPILVKNKKYLNNFLLEKGIEVRFKHYYNCQKLFGYGEKCFSAEKYENELICLPNHPKISLSYIDYIVKNIELYYSRQKNN